MSARAAILLVAGSPRLQVDAVRHITVNATGGTAERVRARLASRGVEADILASVDACKDSETVWRRYYGRPELEEAIRAWLEREPNGVVMMSAAVNDYEIAQVERWQDGVHTVHGPDDKLPSRGDELVIRLEPASKVIDQLGAWGHRGPLIGFKYEAAETVVASAEALRRRTGAALVVANSIDTEVQALVDAHGVSHHRNRQALEAALADRLAALAEPVTGSHRK